MLRYEHAKLTQVGDGEHWMFEAPAGQSKEIVNADPLAVINDLGQDGWHAQVTDTHEGHWVRFLLSRQTE